MERCPIRAAKITELPSSLVKKLIKSSAGKKALVLQMIKKVMPKVIAINLPNPTLGMPGYLPNGKLKNNLIRQVNFFQAEA